MQDAIRRDIAATSADLFALCEALVRADSAQPIGDTREAAGVLSRWLRQRGLAAELRGRVETKPNVVCVTGDGDGNGRTLGFNGHLDTLPAGDGWTLPTHAVTRRDGRLYGLGVGNMKAGVAALAVAFAVLARNRSAWRGRLVLTAVADEVLFGPDGAAWLLEDDPRLLGDALINGEGPGDMGLAIAEKGLLWVEISASGPPGQGMLAQRGSSPIAQLADAISVIDRWNQEVVTPPREVAVLGDTAGADRQRLSVNFGRVSGGGLTSQVATDARVELDLRLPPGLTLATMGSRLDDVVSAHRGLVWRMLKGWDPSWTPAHSEVARAVAKAAATARGAAPAPVVRLPASDAARWRRLGIPAVSYGPQPLLASGTNDWVSEQDVLHSAETYALAGLQYLRSIV